MTQQPLYGSHNPHPLSQMRRSLGWEGKYDEYEQGCEVDLIDIDPTLDGGADFSMSYKQPREVSR